MATSSSSLIQWTQRSRWTLVIAGCWVEAVSGLSYVFSTYSPALKSQLSYNQSRIDTLAAAKDLGDHIGLAAGFLCRIWPNWAVLSLGSMLILLGYASLWLLTNHHIPSLPFWLVCIIMFLGTNGTTFLDTSALVTCLPHFPSNRGTVVGLLKGFKGLSGAIFNQIYASFLAPDEASLILLIALGPAVVMVPLIFLMGPGGTVAVSKVDSNNHKDNITCSLLYAAASILAAYMLTVALLQDLSSLSSTSINVVFTVVLFLILLLPLSVPRIANTVINKHKESAACPLKESLLACDDCEGGLNHDGLTDKASMEAPQASVSYHLTEDAKLSDSARPPPSDPSKKAGSASALKTESSAADYTLQKAFGSANFWLLFLSILFTMGSGTTAFDNLSQMAEAQGYDNTQIFISMSNIWNFVGRLVGGYASEISTRGHGHPRTLVLAVAQLTMAAGHILFATALPGTIHIALFLVATGYGAEWAVFPTALSELFGLQNFSVLYNFVNIASPTGSLIYSSFIAGLLYDRQAKKQSGGTATDDGTPLVCEGTICFGLTFVIMAAVCMTGAALTIALTLRTRALYSKS